LYSRETLVATLSFAIKKTINDEEFLKEKNLTDFHIQVKIKPTYSTHKGSIIPISMIARDSHYLDKCVKKIYDKLDLDNLVNNAYDIFTELTLYLKKQFENSKTGNTIIVSNSNGSDKLQLDQQHSLSKYIIQADYSRKIQE